MLVTSPGSSAPDLPSTCRRESREKGARGVSAKSKVTLLVTLVALAVFTGCAEAPPVSTQDLEGIWRTDSASHRDRFFEVRSEAVIFGRGKYKGFDYYPLVRAELVGAPAGRLRRFRLFYREEDGEIGELEVALESGREPRLRFGRRDDWWKRSPNRPEDDPDV